MGPSGIAERPPTVRLILFVVNAGPTVVPLAAAILMVVTDRMYARLHGAAARPALRTRAS